jgi:hypothetical protein
MSVASTMSPSDQIRRLTRFLEDEQRRKFFGSVKLLLKNGNIVQIEVSETVLTEHLK